jgi:predicted RNA polymerase sigma factor
VSAEHRIEDLLRELAPQVLGTLVRRHGQFGACEDAVQEALLAAALQWPGEGVPDRPRSWLLTVVYGPRAGLALLGTLDADDRMTHTHRLEAVRAHLLERAGDTVAARESYLRAARMTASVPEQRYLTLRAAQLHLPSVPPSGP